jgi:hypothetical protein
MAVKHSCTSWKVEDAGTSEAGLGLPIYLAASPILLRIINFAMVSFW